ncbi:MAG: amidohydrolase [Gemmataceae bacterium]|nr:amidohydrolase [Gemmataceae bacterium]MCI0741235.1 amidohydrolase [Gemmataceae bacterium]
MLKQWAALLVFALAVSIQVEAQDDAPSADFILHHAKILTVDAQFRIVEAIAVKGDRILAVGDDKAVLKHRGKDTKVLDAQGRTVLPGLYDSHTHPVGAASSEIAEPLPYLRSLEEVFAYIRKKTETTPEGEWIVLRFAFPTRLKDARFPSRAELDKVAPKHPVYYHAGPAGLVNTMGLKVSGITKDTPNPANGVIVKDAATGEPTGMLRNAGGVLKGKGLQGDGKTTPEARRAAVKKLFGLYNAQGITSVADRNGGRDNFDLYHSLLEKGELTVRINVARSFGAGGKREDLIARLEGLPGKDGRAGPTGKGGVWIRIGPIKFFLDGGMLNGTAFMRQPWPKGDTYQITEDNYRGLLFVQPEQVKVLVEEASRRGWQVTAHTAGEGAMDVLLDAYESVDRLIPIKELRHCITHANFPSQKNFERCKKLGVCADVQPAWLYCDGSTLDRVLGKERIRWFQPYKSWLEYTTIGGGSDHMLRFDDKESTNPWNPWLGIETALTRKTQTGQVLVPEERLSREDALRLYTIHNAYINREEKEKGSLEPGKLADFIVIDRDYMTCPLDSVAQTRVLTTVVGGKVVYQAKD